MKKERKSQEMKTGKVAVNGLRDTCKSSLEALVTKNRHCKTHYKWGHFQARWGTEEKQCWINFR